jgi:hypothetical protein
MRGVIPHGLGGQFLRGRTWPQAGVPNLRDLDGTLRGCPAFGTGVNMALRATAMAGVSNVARSVTAGCRGRRSGISRRSQ